MSGLRAAGSAFQRSTTKGAAPTTVAARRRTAEVVFQWTGTLYAKQKSTGGVYQPLCPIGGSILRLTATDDVDAGGGAAAPPTKKGSKSSAAAAPNPTVFQLEVLDAYDASNCLVNQPISEGMQMNYHYETGCALWPTVDETNTTVIDLGFRFAAKPPTTATDATHRFVESFNQCLYCALTGTAMATLPSSAPSSHGDDGGEKSGGDDDYDYVATYLSSEVPVDTEDVPSYTAGDVGDVELSTVATCPIGPGGRVNRCFADSVVFSRAVVVRDELTGGDGTASFRFQAHRYNADDLIDEVPASFALREVDLGGRPSAAGSATTCLLKKQEQRLLIVNEAGNIADVDLQNGKVVQTYKPGYGGDYKVLSVAHSDKYGASGAASGSGNGPANSDDLVTCLTVNGIFNIDTRLNPRQCAVVEELSSGTSLPRTYDRVRFTCHATSAKGYLAIADQDGCIKLFTGPPGARREVGKTTCYPKTAKTVLVATPGKIPIRHLDLTADGHYILATTAKYLLVIGTVYMDDRSKVVDGFATRMGKHKPSPVRLELNAEQIVALGGFDRVNFTKATFDDAAGSGGSAGSDMESWITAVTGSSIVTWNFARVKRAVETRQLVYGDLFSAAGSNAESIVDLHSVAAPNGRRLAMDEEARLNRERAAGAGAANAGGTVMPPGIMPVQVRFMTGRQVGFQGSGRGPLPSSGEGTVTHSVPFRVPASGQKFSLRFQS